MINIKKEYNNGTEVVVEVYADTGKIFEKSINLIWDATEEMPITAPKARINVFTEIDPPLEKDNSSSEENGTNE